MGKLAVIASVVSVCWLAGVRSAPKESRGTNLQRRDTMERDARYKIFNPETMPKPTGYSHVATVEGGKIVYVAGQVALDKSGNLVGKGDFRAQAQQVFTNLKAAVEAAGGDFNDVVKLNYYCVDISHLPEVREVRDKFINMKNPPTSTAIEVSKLFRPEFLIEVEAVAVVK
jgi:enamine deaminase RidA (YjgF/YER057c/UK114 family)